MTRKNDTGIKKAFLHHVNIELKWHTCKTIGKTIKVKCATYILYSTKGEI